MRIIIFILLLYCSTFSCTTPLFITKDNLILYAIKEGDKVGYIDQRGKIRIPCQYDPCFYYSDGIEICDRYLSDYAVIGKDGKFGMIDLDGNLKIPIMYDAISSYTLSFDDKYAVQKDGKWGIINLNNEVIVPFVFDNESISTQPFYKGIIDGLPAIYDTKNEKIIPLDYDYVGYFYNGYAEFRPKDKEGVGLLDTNFNEILAPVYKEIGRYKAGLLNVDVGSHWEYINLKGEQLIDNNYEEANDFYSGYAIVAQNGQYGVIDTTGKEIVPLQYDYLSNVYSDDLIEFRKGDFSGSQGLINVQGDTVLPACFSYLFYYEGIVDLELNQQGTSGLINLKKQKVIIPFNFIHIDYGILDLSYLEFEDEHGNRFYGYINRWRKIIWSNNKPLLKKKLKRTKKKFDPEDYKPKDSTGNDF